MTSSGGAGVGVMAAALVPRNGAEAEGWRRLLRAVTRLQACARGFLLRRRLRSVREQFEAAVLEIEGSLKHLSWSGSVLQRPSFGNELTPEKPLDPGEAVENKTIPKKTLEKPNPLRPEPSTPNPTNLGSGAAKNPEKGEKSQSGSQDWDSESVTSEWDSPDLETHPEIPMDLQGLSRSELQSYRNHLMMELLWIQQAIASRKNFLMLKQKLGIPDHSRGIPEFLDWGGEILELQQQQL